MSREIKFRAWSPKENRMINDAVVFSGTTQKEWREGVIPISATVPHRRDAIWQQYTGIKDRNGVEIYEGDIVVYYKPSGGHDSHYGKRVVEWGNFNNGVGFNISVRKRQDHEPKVNWVVIGNIYENKELLK